MARDPERIAIDLRLEEELKDRIEAASKKVFGNINRSAYVRMAIIERLAKDEDPPPEKAEGIKKGKKN